MSAWAALAHKEEITPSNCGKSEFSYRAQAYTYVCKYFQHPPGLKDEDLFPSQSFFEDVGVLINGFDKDKTGPGDPNNPDT